jgi:hypothetical protein
VAKHDGSGVKPEPFFALDRVCVRLVKFAVQAESRAGKRETLKKGLISLGFEPLILPLRVEKSIHELYVILLHVPQRGLENLRVTGA